MGIKRLFEMRKRNKEDLESAREMIIIIRIIIIIAIFSPTTFRYWGLSLQGKVEEFSIDR